MVRAADGLVRPLGKNRRLPIFTNPRGASHEGTARQHVVLPQPASRRARRALEPRQAANPTCQPDLVVADFGRPGALATNDLGLPWMHDGMASPPQVADGLLRFATTGGRAWLLTKLPCTSDEAASSGDGGFFQTYQRYTGINFTLSGPALGSPYGISVKICDASPTLAGQRFYLPVDPAPAGPRFVSFAALFPPGLVPQIEHVAWEDLPAAEYTLDEVRLRGECHAPGNTGKLFDPGMGRFIYGASIDGDDTPEGYISRMQGKVRPMLWNTYVVMFPDHFPTDGLYKVAETLLALPYPTILALFAMPQSDGALDSVTEVSVRQLAQACRYLNDRGLRILLNFGHEGNGYWYKYGGQPKKYREAWRRVSTAVRAVAGEMTALVWHMNSVIPNYWANGMQWDPELDTNGNGVIDREDDPFTPYFPGPEYVDWVGLSFYHYGVEYPWKENLLPESPTKFRDGLDGRMGTNPHRFYTMFAERYNLPMAVMETGCAYYVDSDPGPGRFAMAQAWWRQVYARELFRELPLLRLIEYFEHIHPDEGTTRDYRLTIDPAMAQALLDDLPLDMISQPGDGKWTRSTVV
ncbi:glycoside hydrolase superfamily [Hyaloraphidium curvatum]|nr:glycoside hydrolase superfamily [Hyaloraphidium curvatum]